MAKKKQAKPYYGEKTKKKISEDYFRSSATMRELSPYINVYYLCLYYPNKKLESYSQLKNFHIINIKCNFLQETDYIKGLLTNDRFILKKIYANFSGRIATHIQRCGGTNEDAKDVFHDALIVIYQKAQSPDFQLSSQFYTYLHSICHFIWDRKKKKKSNNTVTIPEDIRLIDVTNVETEIFEREKHGYY